MPSEDPDIDKLLADVIQLKKARERLKKEIENLELQYKQKEDRLYSRYETTKKKLRKEISKLKEVVEKLHKEIESKNKILENINKEIEKLRKIKLDKITELNIHLIPISYLIMKIGELFGNRPIIVKKTDLHTYLIRIQQLQEISEDKIHEIQTSLAEYTERNLKNIRVRSTYTIRRGNDGMFLDIILEIW